MTAQTLVHGCSSQINKRSSISSPTIRTALIFNSVLVSSGLQDLLAGTPFVLTEAASAADPTRFPHLAHEPALVIIEANQSTPRTLQIAKQVNERFPAARIVALADWFDLNFVVMGRSAGIAGFCLAASAPDVLMASLELVMLGEGMVPSAVLASYMQGATQDRNMPLQGSDAEEASEARLPDLKAYKLSARETEILGLLREGNPNKIIAHKLNITESTTKVHVKAILRKIGATNRTQAAIWASQRQPHRDGASADV
ncbi:LuxR C-terminal-related transcriptional regulator [Microvirga pakistanensis]|uniref:LuxR C-terminal-related transcriptional regulator n=1 Tax=Microvirga pakistanensis TaxID=1682650 RepID=UPI00141B44AF|nr:response regulator transcription factor [Microvirga pakistanensis]